MKQGRVWRGCAWEEKMKESKGRVLNENWSGMKESRWSKS